MGILCAVLFLLLGGCGISWFSMTEVVDVEVDVPPSGAARSNPYYAAECYLKELEVETQTSWSPPTDPQQNLGLLFFFAPKRHPLPRRDSALLKWVREGGHLVVVARRPELGESYVEDPLTEPFGIRASEGGSVKLVPLPQGGSGSVNLDGEPQLALTFLGDYWLADSGGTEDEGDLRCWEYSYGGRLRAVGFQRGKGLVTILSEADLWETGKLREADHARFLHQVARLRIDPTAAPPKRAIIVRGDSPPSLLSLLWEVAWPLILTLLIWLVVWLYTRTRRFGPVLPAPNLDRRRLGEHLEAAGRFLWRHRAQASLIEPVREALLDRVRRRRPDWVHLSRDAQVEALAEQGEAHPRDVEDALYGAPPRSPDRFTSSVTLLEKIRRSL
jgi:uncharacterized protein DUF4350